MDDHEHSFQSAPAEALTQVPDDTIDLIRLEMFMMKVQVHTTSTASDGIVLH
jgi:hypothetical protein